MDYEDCIIIPNDSMLIGPKQLTKLDNHGRVCELCGNHLNSHRWVILDKDGFAIVMCSNYDPF